MGFTKPAITAMRKWGAAAAAVDGEDGNAGPCEGETRLERLNVQRFELCSTAKQAL